MVNYYTPGVENSKWDDFLSEDSNFPNVSIYGNCDKNQIIVSDDGWIDCEIVEEIISKEKAEETISLAINASVEIEYKGIIPSV